jgi:hypothetical protein
MRSLIFLSCLIGCTAIGYAEDSSGAKSAAKAQLDALIDVDEKIENLQKAKLQKKGEMTEAIERGASVPLPRAGKRASREAGEDMQDIKEMNQQLLQLEQKRQQIIMSLQ